MGNVPIASHLTWKFSGGEFSLGGKSPGEDLSVGVHFPVKIYP